MYVDATVAALAVFVWALTDALLVRSIAYNVMFLAGAVTVLFNINPLMRYDGYYIVSDLTEIPNLRQRSFRYVMGWIRRLFLGVKVPEAAETRRLHATLLIYGVAAGIYRVALLLAIAAILVAKFMGLGLLMVVLFLDGLVLGAVRRMTAYLWYAEETAHVRWRAVAISLALLIVLPTVLAFVPLPSQVRAAGVVSTERETLVRTRVAGFVERAGADAGQYVEKGETLALMANDSLIERVAEA